MFTAHPPTVARSLAWSWRRFGLSALAGCGFLACAVAWAAPDTAAPTAAPAVAEPGVRWYGFGTLGLTRTNEDNAEFVRDLSQPNGAGTRPTPKVDSLLGLQANVDFSPSTEGVVQLVSRYHADSSYRPELTWAFLRHDFSADMSLRVGRLGTEFYMLGDSRLVGYSNLNVRPSSDFYGSLVFSYIDGLDFSLTRPLGSGLLKTKLFAGRSPEKTPYAPGLLWDLGGSKLAGAYLDYQTGPWQLRASHAQVQFGLEPPTDALLKDLGDPLGGLPYLLIKPEMTMAGQRASFSSLGLVYDQGPFNVQAMLNQIRHESLAYLDSRAAYVLASYRLGKVTPYVGVSKSRSEPMPGGLDPVTYLLVVHSIADQTTTTLGARWDVAKNLALKAQVDLIHGKPESVFLLKGTEAGGWDGRMNVFSLTLDYVF